MRGVFLLANPSIISGKKIMLLYDFDANKPDENFEHFCIRSVPENKENVIAKKGIENLLPSGLFEGNSYPGGRDIFDKRFYPEKVIPTEYGRQKIIPEFNKKEFCKYVCQERLQSDDFRYFESVIGIFKEFLARYSSSKTN
jgi:hypothetical protein